MGDHETARFDQPDFYAGDPHATFRRLRAEDPVHWYEEGKFWVVTKYDDIKFISSRPDLFSSERIAIMSDLLCRRDGVDPTGYGERGIMFMDPPDHTAHRRTIGVRFTPRVVNELDDHVRAVINGVLDNVPGDRFDWIEHVAEPIPVFVFSALLGLPRADWHKVSAWATVITNTGTGTATDDDMKLIFEEIGPYLYSQVQERRENPQDDLLTMLAHAEVDGVPFDDVMTISYATTLLAAGSETTQSLIAGMAASLAAHPGQATKLFAQGHSSAGVVEETLRWWTPVVSMARQATTDVPLNGVVIKQGDGVLLAYLSGNRDEARWGADADVYDISRPEASGHVAFGFGEHFCMGVHLARREGRILVEELCRRAMGIAVDGEPILRPSTLMHTYDKLPVHLLR